MRLRAAGLDKNTNVILTADHGEEFGEHGTGRHGTRSSTSCFTFR